MYVRKTTIEDLPAMLEIYAEAREFMKNTGNPTQWITYPEKELLVSDIEADRSYVVIQDQAVCGTFVFTLGEDEAYKVIEGSWLNDRPYGVIHRLAGTKEKGIFDCAVEFCLSKVCDLRVDTHNDNRVMQSILEKRGFTKCGIIYLKDDMSDHSPRIAYQYSSCKDKLDCGGCLYQDLSYEKQLKVKEKEVRRELEKRNVCPENFDSIHGCDNILHYRNKMEYTFGNVVKDGPLTLGMHKKGSYISIITVDDCMLVHNDFNIILDAVLDFAKEKDYAFYHKKAHTGILRNLIIRQGIRTDELLVNIVTTSDDFAEDEFRDLILSLKLENKVVGILRTLDDNIADMVRCEGLHILYGRDYYMEKVCNLDFKVSAFSFFQTNVPAVEKLYMDAISLLSDIDNKTVFDLYSGTGTISQIVSPHAKEVFGIEINPDAVKTAKENAELNNLTNCNFICGDVFKELEKLEVKPDVIVVDPPRVGLEPKALEKIISYGVPEIVYISCNPKTLCENLMAFEMNGYRVKYMKPYDNFPFTKHIESIVLLTKN
ncbi:MAG: 23S rRNA (uracil(1939)-C(5))-methyltransferase RlmD [Clostridia bacterium]|nr:23S rRNA (uracil(1939)-C(5))-methyltransferase RlmD [Clostridia bacterium]